MGSNVIIFSEKIDGNDEVISELQTNDHDAAKETAIEKTPTIDLS
ncbi:hypothetical protein [Escherichia coli]